MRSRPSTIQAVKPLSHPAIKDISVETLLHALADPVRVAIFATIVGQECSQNCSTFLTVGDHPVPKSTLSQHFKVLREAGLIRSERRGVEMHNTSRCAEVDQRFPGLIATIVEAYNIQQADQARARRRSARRANRPQTPASTH